METKQYDKAIQDLENIKLEVIRVEIKKAKYQLVGFCLFAITAGLTIVFLVL